MLLYCVSFSLPSFHVRALSLSLSFCHVPRKQPGENCPRFSDSLIIRRCGYVEEEEEGVCFLDGGCWWWWTFEKDFFFFFFWKLLEKGELKYKSKI